MYKDFWMGVRNHFAERRWGTNVFCMFKIRYEKFSKCVKLFSTLVPRIKNDPSLKALADRGTVIKEYEMNENDDIT